MKKVGLFVSSLMFVLVFSGAAFAQTEKTVAAAKSKVAVIDTSILDDKERGIKKLVEVYKSVNWEDTSANPSFQIQRVAYETRRKELQKEIDSLIAQNKPVNEAYVKLRKLDSEFSRTLGKRNDELSSKYKSSVLPVYEEIKIKAKEFAELKGYSMVIEKLEINFLFSSGVDDVTLEFIKFCNDSFGKEKSTNK